MEGKKTVINSKTFRTLKVSKKCKKKLFDKYVGDSFIFVNQDGKVSLYDTKSLNTFTNLREFIGLFGSKFFNSDITNTDLGEELKIFYEQKTKSIPRNIYKYKV